MKENELKITAELAYLDLTEDEFHRLEKEVSQMLQYFSKMMEVDVEKLEATTHALVKNNRLRDDHVETENISDDILGQAPELEDRYIVIPNVL